MGCEYASHRLRAAGSLQATDCGLQVCGLRATDCGLRVTDCGLQMYGPQVGDCGQSAGCRLSI